MKQHREARYQIQPNVQVTCFLNVLRENKDSFRTYIGINETTQIKVPVGTRVYLDSDSIGPNGSITTITTVIVDHAEINNNVLHICEPLETETLYERRQEPRVEIQLPFRFGNDEIIARNGNLKGLGVSYHKRVRMLGLNIDEAYDFKVPHKEKEYTYKGRICHILYNWKNFQHTFGFEMQDMDDELETVLNALIDPNFNIDTHKKKTVDVVLGKVSEIGAMKL